MSFWIPLLFLVVDVCHNLLWQLLNLCALLALVHIPKESITAMKEIKGHHTLVRMNASQARTRSASMQLAARMPQHDVFSHGRVHGAWILLRSDALAAHRGPSRKVASSLPRSALPAFRRSGMFPSPSRQTEGVPPNSVAGSP